MTKSKRILVVAAHADDEALGCGGTIAKHAQSGDEVKIVVLADGVSSRQTAHSGEAAEREAGASAAARILGALPPVCLGLPDNRLDSVDLLDIVQAIEQAIQDFDPEVLYVHHLGDLNVDHTIAHRACLTAARPQPWSKIRAIYAFEVLSSTGWLPGGQNVFQPTHYVNIADQFELKMRSLRAYDQEMRDAPHARSYDGVEALAKFRGHSIGVAYAEAFEVVRQIDF